LSSTQFKIISLKVRLFKFFLTDFDQFRLKILEFNVSIVSFHRFD